MATHFRDRKRLQHISEAEKDGKTFYRQKQMAKKIGDKNMARHLRS
jgi:hypothetical protein